MAFVCFNPNSNMSCKKIHYTYAEWVRDIDNGYYAMLDILLLDFIFDHTLESVGWTCGTRKTKGEIRALSKGDPDVSLSRSISHLYAS